ncbi:MAG: NAD(P)-binding protein [Dehalococcoidia bacterium]|nr:NAD(P)-binding protein [Dehalococcoidia bacterium]
MPRDVKYLLIGGGIASFNAAKLIRQTDTEGSVLIVGEEPLPPYDRPPLSKEVMRGEKSIDEIVFEPAGKLAEQAIDLALGVRVDALDATTQQATLSGGETVHFEKALIATGGSPIRLPLPGADLAGVHYLRTAQDAGAIAAEARPGRHAVIIGGGFIGLKVAASLTQRGVQVTVIEALPHIWARFADASLAGYFQDYCSREGVTFRTNETVTELRGEGRVGAVALRGGDVLACDFVCIGVGIRPNVELAQAAGLEVDNGIVVDDYLRTSNPEIYAAGDVINYPDATFGKRRRVEHWGHAEYTGQVAGRNMAGEPTPYSFLTYVWSDIFDLHLEFAGDEGERDEVLLRGRYEDNKFTVLYLKEDRLTAYFALNTPAREYGILRRFILTKKDIGGHKAELQDPSFELRSLLQP